jgi:hypothetical protein
VGRADGKVVVGPADTTGGCEVGLSVEEGGGWRCGAAQWGRASGGRAQGLAPCWGEEAVREAGWRGVAIVDTELAGNVLGDLDMDPGAAKEGVEIVIMNYVTGIKAKIGLSRLCTCAVCVQWRNKATLFRIQRILFIGLTSYIESEQDIKLLTIYRF